MIYYVIVICYMWYYCICDDYIINDSIRYIIALCDCIIVLHYTYNLSVTISYHGACYCIYTQWIISWDIIQYYDMSYYCIMLADPRASLLSLAPTAMRLDNIVLFVPRRNPLKRGVAGPFSDCASRADNTHVGIICIYYACVYIYIYIYIHMYTCIAIINYICIYIYIYNTYIQIISTLD